MTTKKRDLRSLAAAWLASCCIAVATCSLVACHDDDDTTEPPVQQALAVTAVNALGDEVEPVLPRYAAYGSITVSVSGRDTTCAVTVSSDADWLRLTRDTLSADAIVTLATETNDTGRRRIATLTFTEAVNAQSSSLNSQSSTPRTATLAVTQLSAADADTNGDDARQQLYVGYGYDVYKALDSPMSARTAAPILNVDYLWQMNATTSDQIIQDCHLSRTDLRYVASNDIHAHGIDLTEQQTSDSNNRINGCVENCLMAQEVLDPANGTLDQQAIGHGSMEKAVAARIIDRGAIIDLQRRGLVPFTQAYEQRLYQIQHSNGTLRRQLIEQLLMDYGTHVILQADLGGRIDYTFTMQKSATFNSQQEMEQEINYTLGRITDSERTGNSRTPSSVKSRSGAITVRGGSTDTRQRLEADIRALGGSGQIDPTHIIDWLATINYSDNPAADASLDVIHFGLIPVWDLVYDELRSEFRDATLSLVQRSDCQLPASFLGTDIYELQPQQDKTLFLFQNVTATTSLCRLLYYEGEPVLQVCSEYVPKIRTDERVTIAYPIYKQHIRLNQGLFLGDGIHRPAYVSFSGGDCYVNPIDTLAQGAYIEKFWYVNGSLLLNNPTTITGLTGRQRSVQDDALILHTDDANGSKTHYHPLVKVGSTFWTRYDIDHYMLFAEKENQAGMDYLSPDGVLYTMFQYETNYEFNAYNAWTWGYAPNTFYDGQPNTKWYLPTADQVRALHQFLGFNPKALFREQASGWEAGFNGYYGASDIKNRNRNFSGGQRDLRYRGELCVISSKNSSDYSDACLMVLDTDYTISVIDDATFTGAYRYNWRTNFYPVRPVRGYMYEYPTLATIRQNTR